MQLLSLVAFHSLGQVRWVVHMTTHFQSLLELGNTPFDRFEHFMRLVTSIAEHQDPSIFTELLSHALRICLQHPITVF